MSGLEATRRIMEIRPTPIVIVSRSVSAAEVDSTMDALRAGAMSAVESLSSRRAGGVSESAERICRELFVMSQVKVVRQRFNHSRRESTAWSSCCTTPSPSIAARTNGTPPRVVGIVASTGGPHAVEVVLASIGVDYPAPIVLVQHMTESFHAGFISWLDRISPQTVSEARDGELLEPGRVYVAPADKHLLVRAGPFAVLDDGPPVCGQRASGTVLLQSLAKSYGASAAGVVLTGMGDDGADGLLAIRRAGGYAIAEDESTAVVNGMPEAARVRGATSVSLPLSSIGPAVKRLAPSPREVDA
jgi:two-component system chemotaxis response regulator CheB